MARRQPKGFIQGKGLYLIVLIIILCAFFSLWPIKSRKFNDFEASKDIKINGELNMPERSGHAKILFGDKVTYQGGLKNGRFSGPGTLTFKDGRKLESEFQEGKISKGLLTLKDGQIWKQKEDSSWELLKK